MGFSSSKYGVLTMQSSALWAVRRGCPRCRPRRGTRRQAVVDVIPSLVLLRGSRLRGGSARSQRYGFPLIIAVDEDQVRRRRHRVWGGFARRYGLQGPAARKRSRCSANLLLTLCCRIGGVEAEALPDGRLSINGAIRIALVILRVYKSPAPFELNAELAYRHTRNRFVFAVTNQSL